ncbi:transcriptional regulator FtsR [Rothia uropygioeca]|uniref:transcriptional regulator FtsR n=1 Tax=Kocuria sp. 257 TaxID=2021970 RepID=UPI00101342B0|nr:MerR family transcriptional regulator [Kocuria sp. 257]
MSTTPEQQATEEPSEENSARQAKDKTIGQVLSHLEGSFPGLSASKIRFLEDRGLVFPQRTNTGYRKYSSEDIERLRYVLTLQRDQYLPLKVIKEKVDELERQGFPRDGEASAAGEPGVADTPPRPEKHRRYTIRELSRHTSVDLPMLRELINYGLIEEGPDGTFDEYAARVTALCSQLTAHGLQPRHLRPFRAAADREVALVAQTIAPMASRRDERSREKASETAREISALCTNLHATLVADQVEKSW